MTPLTSSQLEEIEDLGLLLTEVLAGYLGCAGGPWVCWDFISMQSIMALLKHGLPVCGRGCVLWGLSP